MRKGGYEIINLNDLPLSTEVTSTSVDLYEKLLKSKKVVLLSSLKIDDKTFNDCFMFVDKKTDEIVLKNSAYIITVEDDGTITTVENKVEIDADSIIDLMESESIDITKNGDKIKLEDKQPLTLNDLYDLLDYGGLVSLTKDTEHNKIIITTNTVTTSVNIMKKTIQFKIDDGMSNDIQVTLTFIGNKSTTGFNVEVTTSTLIDYINTFKGYFVSGVIQSSMSSINFNIYDIVPHYDLNMNFDGVQLIGNNDTDIFYLLNNYTVVFLLNLQVSDLINTTNIVKLT